MAQFIQHSQHETFLIHKRKKSVSEPLNFLKRPSIIIRNRVLCCIHKKKGPNLYFISISVSPIKIPPFINFQIRKFTHLNNFDILWNLLIARMKRSLWIFQPSLLFGFHFFQFNIHIFMISVSMSPFIINIYSQNKINEIKCLARKCDSEVRVKMFCCAVGWGFKWVVREKEGIYFYVLYSKKFVLIFPLLFSSPSFTPFDGCCFSVWGLKYKAGVYLCVRVNFPIYSKERKIL